MADFPAIPTFAELGYPDVARTGVVAGFAPRHRRQGQPRLAVGMAAPAANSLPAFGFVAEAMTVEE